MYVIKENAPELAQAMNVVAEAFPGISEESLEQDTAAHIVGITHSFYNEQRLVGFASYVTCRSIVYLAGVALVREAQGQNLTVRSMIRMVNSSDRPYLALVTQNPCMMSSLRRVGRPISPQSLSTAVSKDLHELSGVPIGTSPIHYGRYPSGGLYGHEGAPFCRDEILNKLCADLPTDAGMLRVATVNL